MLAAGFLFDRAELAAFEAFQEEELTSAELSALKGFQSQVLVEKVAAHARKLALLRAHAGNQHQ